MYIRCCLLLLIVINPVWAETMKIAMPEEFKPYSYSDQGSFKGIDLEIGQALYERLSWNVDFQPMPWTRQLAYAEKGLASGILTVYCEDQKDYLAISNEAFYQTKISLFALKTKPKLASLESLPEGAIIGVVR